jgi:D-alanyl-D-alanine carboxypeptidase
MNTSPALQQLVERMDRGSGAGPISLVVASITSPDDRWEVHSRPHFTPQSPYFVASTTKLYVATVALRLHELGVLDLDSRLIDHTSVDLSRLHKTPAQVASMTVRQALSHTTGLPNYLEDAKRGNPSLLEAALANDQRWGVRDAVDIARRLGPRFSPGTPGRAYYSDTNYQLVGDAIQQVTAMPLAAALQTYVCEPLNLRDTYLFDEAMHAYGEVEPFMVGNSPARLPQLMTSVGADGGMVSSAQDGQTFLRALMTGQLLQPHTWQMATSSWNRIFFPFRYGTGIMKLQLPRILTAGADFSMVGHGGATGSLLFAAPQHDVMISGTINRIEPRSLAYKLAVKSLRLWIRD